MPSTLRGTEWRNATGNETGRSRQDRVDPHRNDPENEYIDDEDDDEPVIVYKETSSRRPSWALSQMSTTSARGHRSTVSRKTHEYIRDENEAVVADLVSRKRQRRSGSRRYRRGSELSAYDYEFDSDNEGADDFASLRSMMGRMSQDRKKVLGPNGSNPKKMSQSQTDAELEATKEIRDESLSSSPDSIDEGRCIPEINHASREVENKVERDKKVVGEDVHKRTRKSIPTPEDKQEPDSSQQSVASELADTEDNGATSNEKRETLCSPPDFDFCGPNDYDDEDDENDEDNCYDSQAKGIDSNKKSSNVPKTKVPRSKSRLDYDAGRSWRQGHYSRQDGKNRTMLRSQNKNRSSSSVVGSLAKKRSLDHFSSKSSTSISPLSSPKPSTTCTNRKRKLPGRLQRWNVEDSQRDEKVRNTQYRSSQSLTQSSTNVETVKSIVGLRPTHWSRNPKSLRSQSANCTQENGTRQLANPLALAAATRAPFQLSNRAKKPSTVSSKTNTGRGSSCTLSNNKWSLSPSMTTKPPVAPLTTSPVPKATNKLPSFSEEVLKSSFSFAPSFVPTKNAVLLEDAIGEDDSGDECRVVTMTTHQSLFSTASPKRRRRAKANVGEWSRRFKALQNARNNDAARLQNPAFGGRIILDVNDPRKRAKTFMDVTILGHYEGPWINLPEDMKITVPGFAHRHVQQTKGQILKHAPGDRDGGDSTLSQNFFAWFTFTLATARRIELQQMCTLRIYNAVILPCRVSQTFDLPADSIPLIGNPNLVTNDGNGYGPVHCETTVICTHLCERTTN